jgi:hypothetical protein
MADHLNQLESALRDLLAEHDALLALLNRKHQAVRHAKPAVVEECLERENGRVQRIAELEKQRQQIVATLTEQADAEASEPLTISRIAESADAAQRERLLGLAGLLRQRMAEVQRESRIIKQATQGLLKHVHGVMQRVTGAVTGVGTYGSSGRLNNAPIASSSFAATA